MSEDTKSALVDLSLINLYLSKAGPKGLGGTFVPFGFYQVVIEKTEAKIITASGDKDPANKGCIGLSMWCKIEGGTDPEQIGQEIRPYLVLITEEDVEAGRIDPKDPKDARRLDANTARIKQFLVACNDGDAEYAAKIKGKAGRSPAKLADKVVPGTVFYVMWDPKDPAATKTQYDEANFIQKAQYAAALEGTLKYQRKNTLGMSDDEVKKMGLSRGGGSGGERRSRRDEPAGGAIPDNAWTAPDTAPAAPAKGAAVQPGKATKAAKTAPAAPADDAEEAL